MEMIHCLKLHFGHFAMTEWEYYYVDVFLINMNLYMLHRSYVIEQMLDVSGYYLLPIIIYVMYMDTDLNVIEYGLV